MECALIYEWIWNGDLEFQIHYSQDSWNVDCLGASYLN